MPKGLDLKRQIIGEYDLAQKLQDFLDIEFLDISETPIENLTFLVEQELSLKNLKEIDISLTNIKDLTPLYSLSESLEILHINMMDVSKKMLDSIGELSNLTELYLSYSHVVDIKPLQNLKHLKKLDLTGNQSLSDISSLANLNNLTILYLQATNINSREQLSIIKSKKFDRLIVNECLSSEADLLLNVPFDAPQLRM